MLYIVKAHFEVFCWWCCDSALCLCSCAVKLIPVSFSCLCTRSL